MCDKLKLINIDGDNYINPKWVIRVYQDLENAVYVDMLDGDSGAVFISIFSLEETIRLLTE